MDLRKKNTLKPTVGIVILNWNNYKDTKECLEHIKKQTFKDIEVVIVDGKSSDDSTSKIQADFPEFNYVYLKSDTGYSGGNNVGISFFLKTSVKYILSMNNDVFMNKHCVEELVNEAESNSKAGIFGPRMYSYFDKKLFEISGGYVNIFHAKPMPKWVYEDEKSPKEPFLVTKLPGACILLPRNVIKETGLMDENFFLYYADTDWQKRISDLGWLQCSVPTAKAYHKVSATIGRGSKKLLYYDTRDFLTYVKKHHNTVELIYTYFKTWMNKNSYALRKQDWAMLATVNMAYLHFLQSKHKRTRGI